jgi:hypothetical protein
VPNPYYEDLRLFIICVIHSVTGNFLTRKKFVAQPE